MPACWAENATRMVRVGWREVPSGRVSYRTDTIVAPTGTHS